MRHPHCFWVYETPTPTIAASHRTRPEFVPCAAKTLLMLRCPFLVSQNSLERFFLPASFLLSRFLGFIIGHSVYSGHALRKISPE